MCVTTHDRLKKHDLWLVETGCVNCSIQFRVLFQRCVFMLKFINDINHGAIKSKEMSKQISSTVKRVWRVAKLLQQNLFLVCQKCNRLPFGPIKPSSSSTKVLHILDIQTNDCWGFSCFGNALVMASFGSLDLAPQECTYYHHLLRKILERGKFFSFSTSTIWLVL